MPQAHLYVEEWPGMPETRASLVALPSAVVSDNRLTFHGDNRSDNRLTIV